MKKFMLIAVIFCISISSIVLAQGLSFLSSTLWNDLRDIQVAGNYAYCSYAAGLMILDISTIDSPIVIGRFPSPNGYPFWGLCLSGNNAILANDSAGIIIVDISDPTNPTLISSYDTPGSAQEVCCKDSLLYIAEGPAGVEIINISDPNRAVYIGSYYSYNTQGIYVVGNYLFIADDWAGLKIINIIDPSHPILVGAFDAGRPVLCVSVVGNIAYIGMDYNYGLITVDITNPYHPIALGQLQFGEECWDVCVSGNYAFVISSTYYLPDLYVINISNPRQLSQTSVYDTTGAGKKVCINGNHIFLGTVGGIGGIIVLDKS